MKHVQWVFVLPVLGILAGVSSVLAEDTSLPHTAWSPSPIQSDPELRDPLLQRGQAVFQARCWICHGEIPEQVVPGGLPPMPGTQALRARYQGEKPAELERRTDLTPEYITAVVRNGINSMPFFRPTEITNDDLAALGAYLARGRKQ